jgi:hypothetical protein
MTAGSAVLPRELDGPQVRRLTRRSSAQRADTTLMARIMDVWSTVASVGIGLAVLGGWLSSVRIDIAARPPTGGAVVPGSVTAVVTAVIAVAVLVSLLDRLGPISASPAAAAWWLPLPAARRGLLRGELVRICGACVLATAVLALPMAGALTDRPTAGGVVRTVLGSAATAGALVGLVVLLQTRGRGGRLAPVAGAGAVVVSAAAGALALVPSLVDPSAAAAWLPALSGWIWVGAAGIAAVLLLAAGDAGLGRLDAGRLRSSGATSGFAAASVLSLDTRDLGRALAGGVRRSPGRTRRFRGVTRPWQAVVAADLALMVRSPGQLGRLVMATAIPVLAARTDGLDRLPAAVWAGMVLGWLLAAVAVGHPARHAQVQPALDRLLPLSPASVVAARCVTPALLLVPVCGVGGLLVGLGSGRPLAWSGLALAAVPTWVAATLRGAYRPELNWAGPVMSTPMGVVPVGVGATLLSGIDVGVVGALPLGAAVLLGGPPSGVVLGVQLTWSTLLAAGALALVVRRRSSAVD